MAISGVFLLGGGVWGVVGWGGGSHERPRFQSTAQEVFARGQLDVVVCGTGMTAAMI